MSAFEFFFTLYGLVLGRSVVEALSGFARLAHDRQGVKVGWLAPQPARQWGRSGAPDRPAPYQRPTDPADMTAFEFCFRFHGRPPGLSATA